MSTWMKPILAGLLALSLRAQSAAVSTPRFEEYAVAENWRGSAAPVLITTRAERLFRTRLTDAGKDAPNFAGHYRFATWGCGSQCISGAIIDLATGKVFSPPLAKDNGGAMHFSVCQSAYENSGVDFRVTSRLLILRCGLNYSERLQANVPDAHYFVWDGERVNEILRAPHTVGQDAAYARTSLRGFLERFDAGLKGRFSDALVDLDGDGKPEAVVYLTSKDWCGSGGCTTLILVRDGDSWRLLSKIPITRPPIRLVRTKWNGWLSIGVWVDGGGIQPGYEAELRFDGKTYPANPSIPPARPLKGNPEGEILIAPPTR